MTLRVAVIVGPTATGKTRLAVEVAHKLGSEIISADSRQVYRGLDLGTGKDVHEYSRVSPPVTCHLIDVCDPNDVYSLFHYQRDCYRVLRTLARDERFVSGAIPIVMCGGSGLYVEAVILDYRIADVPENTHMRRRLMERSHQGLVEQLRNEDRALHERTDLSSKKRVVRALEIADFAKRGEVRYSEPLAIDVEWSVFGVRVERSELRSRIALRVDSRLEQGMVDEVRVLVEKGIPPDRIAMLGLEYREISTYLRGDVSYGQMVTNLKAKIRQFAKRQMTYFRGMERRGIPITWIQPDDVDVVLNALEAPNAWGMER